VLGQTKLLIATEKVRRFWVGDTCGLVSAIICLPF